MAHYLVDSSHIAQASAHTAAIADQIRTHTAAMMSQLQALDSSWTGQAAASFTQCTQKWHNTQTQVEAALDDISRALAQASHTYADAEVQATSLFV